MDIVVGSVQELYYEVFDIIFLQPFLSFKTNSNKKFIQIVMSCGLVDPVLLWTNPLLYMVIRKEGPIETLKLGI